MSDAQDILDDEDYDPFEAFDAAAGAGAVRNPYPQFAELRREAPIHEGSLWDLIGFHEPMGALLYGDVPQFSVVSYETVSHVLRDGQTFSSSGYAPTMGVVMGHSILEMGDPEHKRYRSLIEQGFTRKAMERWEREIITPVVNRCIDAFADRGRADLVRELTFPFPIHVICAMLGLPEEDVPAFHRWAVALINVGSDPPRGLAASQRLHDYLDGIIDRKREAPADDLIGALARAELDGHRLDNEQIIAFLRLLLPAGGETTYRSSGSLIFGLLARPEQLEALRRDRSLLPQAMEEGLRWEPPLTTIGRWAARDTEIAGVEIPAGSALTVGIGSANHDETRWESPEEFDLFRKPLANVAFASGPHVCLGMHLARVETTIALNAILDRLPGLRLDPDAEDVHVTGFVFRAPTSLPVLFG